MQAIRKGCSRSTRCKNAGVYTITCPLDEFSIGSLSTRTRNKLKAANRPWTSWKDPEVHVGSVATNLSLVFSYLYFLCLLLSERSLGDCIGFGGSAQAGESSKHCLLCFGTGGRIDGHFIEHLFILSLGHICLSVAV